ncbi:hypothetical protein JTE90_019978 [Oedothorax gibbosus]|uniref:Uncharacterized protein n=1 Tax=Oedothorax gibbosus TaxID=931172 RepID=A0AAV6TGJ0_9ARAC|nr:hypothetical protein JTE90_019978 [Oedothorax gibbosus]
MNETTPYLAPAETTGEPESPMDTKDTLRKRSHDDEEGGGNIVPEASQSKKINVQVDVTPPKEETRSEKNTLIKMEHFYYTKIDAYLRYRDMLALDRRRRKYVDCFKRRPILLVTYTRQENTNAVRDLKLLNVYHEMEPVNSQKNIMESMLKPCDNPSCVNPVHKTT